MRLSRRRAVLGWLLLAAVPLGCDGVSPSRTNRPRAVPVTTTPTIAIILPARGAAELSVWEATARREMARTRTLADVRRLEPGDPPEKQAELIRNAVGEAPSALIVMADEPAAVAQALQEARDEGIPVVLLDRDVPLEGSPATLVTYTNERDIAKTIIDAAVQSARKVGFPEAAPAMILVGENYDDHTEERIKAAREELEARGYRVLPEVRYQGLLEDAKQALAVAFATAPHVAIVVAEDDLALKAAATFRHQLDRTQRRFVMVGYTHEKVTKDLAKYNLAAAVVDLNMTEIVRTAFDTALALTRGETVPRVVESPTPVLRSLGEEKEGQVPPFISMPELMKNHQLEDRDSRTIRDETPHG